MNAISVLDSGLLIFYTHTDHFKTSVVPWKPQPFRSCQNENMTFMLKAKTRTLLRSV